MGFTERLKKEALGLSQKALERLLSDERRSGQLASVIGIVRILPSDEHCAWICTACPILYIFPMRQEVTNHFSDALVATSDAVDAVSPSLMQPTGSIAQRPMNDSTAAAPSTIASTRTPLKNAPRNMN